MVKFGLEKDGKLLGIEIHSWDNEEGSFSDYTLDEDEEQSWLVNSKEEAEIVRRYPKKSVKWNWGTYQIPNNSFKPEQLKVVKVQIEVTGDEEVELPSYQTLMEFKLSIYPDFYYNLDCYNRLSQKEKEKHEQENYLDMYLFWKIN